MITIGLVATAVIVGVLCAAKIKAWFAAKKAAVVADVKKVV
jgi:hypothetical protein